MVGLTVALKDLKKVDLTVVYLAEMKVVYLVVMMVDLKVVE